MEWRGSVVVNGTSYSGVLIAPRFVLTASHVSGTAPTAIQFVLNVGGNRTHVIAARAVSVYPGASFPYDDLSVVELAGPAPAGVVIHPLARAPLPASQRITLVGYGGSGNGDVGPSIGGSQVVKRVGDNVIDLVATQLDASGRSSLFYLYDFDGPTGTGAMGGATLGNSIETLVAGSDSGSPAFARIGGVYHLIGINTFVTNPVAGAPNDFKFGMVGGGILLTRPEFLNWIDAITGYGANDADVPTLPQWALILGVTLLSGIAVQARRA